MPTPEERAAMAIDPAADAQRQELLNKVLADLDVALSEVPAEDEAPNELMVLAARLEQLRDDKDVLNEALKNVNAAIDEISKTRIPDAMNAAGFVRPDGGGSFSMESGATCYLATSVFGTIEKDKHAAVLSWLEDRGFGDLISHTVNWQTLRGFVREQLEEGNELHKGIRVHTEVQARIRKGK